MILYSLTRRWELCAECDRHSEPPRLPHARECYERAAMHSVDGPLSRERAEHVQRKPTVSWIYITVSLHSHYALPSFYNAPAAPPARPAGRDRRAARHRRRRRRAPPDRRRPRSTGSRRPTTRGGERPPATRQAGPERLPTSPPRGVREFLGARAGFLAPPQPTRARAARLTSAPLRPTCLCTTQPSRSMPSALCALVGTVPARRQLHRQRRRSRRRVLGLDRLELHRPPAVAAARGRRWRRRRRRWLPMAPTPTPTAAASSAVERDSVVVARRRATLRLPRATAERVDGSGA